MWNDLYLQELFLKETPLIDVRAPIEYLQGSIPYSINLPLLTDQERHLIGICYKQNGQDAAIALGHQLVSGEIKHNRIQSWLDFLKDNPQAQFFCFRGGLRSKTSCQWITENGIERSPIEGGYKRLRQFFLSWITEAPKPNLFRLGGLTGTGKTTLLLQLPHQVDLEGMANHRGSAFGTLGKQPSQITFENLIGLSLLKNQKTMIVEDESKRIGHLMIPTNFFLSMREAPLIILTASIEERVQNIFQDYVLHRDADFFLNATKGLSRKLGGLRTSNILVEINKAFELGKNAEDHFKWIETLLVDYYDPLYNNSLTLEKNSIAFTGNAEQVRQWWNTKLQERS